MDLSIQISGPHLQQASGLMGSLVENNPAKLTFGLDFCENEKTSTVLISTENKEEVEQKRRLLQRNKAASETNTTTGFEEIQQ